MNRLRLQNVGQLSLELPAELLDLPELAGARLLERVELAGHARRRRGDELSAHAFQIWLGRWRGRQDVRLFVARDASHVLAVEIHVRARTAA